MLISIGNYTYNKRHCLGEGTFGKVFEGEDVRTKEKVAIKLISYEVFEHNAYLQNAFEAEISILKRFDHPNIVKFKDVLNWKKRGIGQHDNSKRGEHAYVVMEFCGDGDLREFMKKRINIKISEEEVVSIFRQILTGMKELHKVGVIHRDLKPANILVSKNQYKIADFGFARHVDFESSKLLQSCVGSPMYMDPLILAKKPYGTKCDIWSLGIILFEMLEGNPPHHKSKSQEELVINHFNKGIKFERAVVSKELQSVLSRMLQLAEADRISWEDLFIFFGISDSNISRDINSQQQNRQQSQQQQQIKKMTDEEMKATCDKIFIDLMNVRNNMNFLHMVSVELYENRQLLRSKDSLFDKTIFLISLYTKKKSEKILSELNLLQQKYQQLFKSDKRLLAASNSLRKENAHYQTLFDDVYSITQRNGLLNLIQTDAQISPFLENNQAKADINALYYYCRVIAKQLVNLLLDQANKYLNDYSNNNNQLVLDQMRPISYLIDLLNSENAQEPFYEQCHQEKATYTIPYLVYNQLRTKMISIFV